MPPEEDSERGLRTKGRRNRNEPSPLVGNVLQAACKNVRQIPLLNIEVYSKYGRSLNYGFLSFWVRGHISNQDIET